MVVWLQDQWGLAREATKKLNIRTLDGRNLTVTLACLRNERSHSKPRSWWQPITRQRASPKVAGFGATIIGALQVYQVVLLATGGVLYSAGALRRSTG